MRNKKKPQAQVVLEHLRTRKKITSVEAIGVYAITRLAAVVKQLRNEGHNIVTTRKKGANGMYAEYTLKAS